MSRIRTAVFPVAGRGTRFLPATKALPKEMLPIVDKPLIQYAVEEALAAGAEKLIFVTGASKRAIEDHFDVDAELERVLEQSGKMDLLKMIRSIVPRNVRCLHVRQGGPLGLGHAVLCTREAVGDEAFFVHLADDLIHSDVPCLKQMMDHYAEHGHSVLGVETVPMDQTGNYGVVAVEPEPSGAQRVTRIVEKPKPQDAPSNLAVVGRYILTPAIYDHLARTGRGAGGEIQLTDGIAGLLADEPVHVLPFSGRRYDCGSKIGYLRATVEYALRHPELGENFRAYLQGVWER
ncbi:UTP--glucose-1-phosphate uridylyltransferase GalU [Candidatus Rariloculus sp.]|uniref:UTP--glucose-1-phosphate uridylyltransferase GalU n=1 Tax=Candidatus Rariloculus sp. TaxID=3101265 RepID=UPI003D10BC01